MEDPGEFWGVLSEITGPFNFKMPFSFSILACLQQQNIINTVTN